MASLCYELMKSQPSYEAQLNIPYTAKSTRSRQDERSSKVHCGLEFESDERREASHESEVSVTGVLPLQEVRYNMYK